VVAGVFFMVKELYLQAYTTEEIGEQVGLSGGQLKTEVSSVLEALPKNPQSPIFRRL
jgi:DNA-directed RNA polymerase specialized sigma24 family protein